jgi:pumilio RNA-binding family
MEVVEGEQKEVLFSKVRPQLPGMRRRAGPNSKHLLASK